MPGRSGQTRLYYCYYSTVPRESTAYFRYVYTNSYHLPAQGRWSTPCQLHARPPAARTLELRAVIMTSEWQEQPRSLKQCGPRRVVGLNRSSGGTDAVCTLVPAPSPSCPTPAVAATAAARGHGPRFDARCGCLSFLPRALSLPLPLSPSPRPDGRPGRESDRAEAPASCLSSPLFSPMPWQAGCLDAWTPGCLSGRGATAVTRAVLVALDELSSPAWTLFLLRRDLVV